MVVRRLSNSIKLLLESKLCYGFSDLVSPTSVAMKVIEGIYEGVTTSELII